ncbi:MAG: Lon family ATP-dependent protease [Moorellales bacterium]
MGTVANRARSSQLSRRVAALYNLLSDLYGPDHLVLRASKLEALDLLRSPRLAERVLALQRLVYDDPTLDQLPPTREIPRILADIEDVLADLVARRSLEEQLERKVNERMQKRQEEYLQELRAQVLKETAGPENAQTLRKLALLEKKEQIRLARSAFEVMRPRSLKEIVGQERAVRALLTKLASPFPQHVILYGPPGVGKTTAARLVLEEAKRLGNTPFGSDAPFVEVNGTTLRWDPREVTNPLLGSVHDPIYQGARRDLAEVGVPEPKLGLVSEAHGGVLFIDEIGDMDPLLVSKLLKVLEDKRVYFESSYYDPHDPNVPQYIRKLFEQGAPADFVLIGATTADPEDLHPALRSRCAEVFFDPLSPQDIQIIVQQAARRLGVRLAPSVPEIISEYTIEARKAIGILADAYSLALYLRGQGKRRVTITPDEVYEVIQSARLVPCVTCRASHTTEIGRVFGLGVMAYVGCVLEIEAVAFPAREPGHGQIRFNETAGTMAKDSVFNAAAVIRRLTGKDLGAYDVHINVVGGGNIDGPSAGAAICLALLSAVEGRPVFQDVAITGEISIQGKIKPVGGLVEKLYGAKQAGMRLVLVPKDNQADLPPNLSGLEVVPIATIEEAASYAFAPPGE